MKNKVLIQRGHLTNYGAEVTQGIELSGAKILSCGSKDTCSIEQLEKSIAKNKEKITCGD